jgi:5-formyltetrahydrofolate cyclo-ligase
MVYGSWLMNKKELRNHFKELRANINIPLAPELIRNNFLQNAKPKAGNVIGTYSPFGSELDVGKLNRALVYLGAKLCLPTIVDGGMVFKEVGIDTKLITNKYGILEPEDSSMTYEPSTIIIPILAFNPAKYRLGYGGGYYDKYLSQHKATKIGVAYDAQKTLESFEEPFDIKLDMIITEKSVYN